MFAYPASSDNVAKHTCKLLLSRSKRDLDAAYPTFSAQLPADGGIGACAFGVVLRRPRPGGTKTRRRRGRFGGGLCRSGPAGAASIYPPFLDWARPSRPLVHDPGSNSRWGPTIGRRVSPGTTFLTSATVKAGPPPAILPALLPVLPPALCLGLARYRFRFLSSRSALSVRDNQPINVEFVRHTSIRMGKPPVIADLMIGRDLGVGTNRPELQFGLRVADLRAAAQAQQTGQSTTNRKRPYDFLFFPPGPLTAVLAREIVHNPVPRLFPVLPDGTVNSFGVGPRLAVAGAIPIQGLMVIRL